MTLPVRAIAATLLAAVAGSSALAQDGLVLPSSVDVGAPPVCFVSDDAELVSYCGDCAEPSCGCEDPSCGCEEPTCGCGDDACCGDACGCGDLCGDGCCGPCGAKKPAKPSPCVTSHKGLFYANDFSYLKDPCYNGSLPGRLHEAHAGRQLRPLGHARCRRSGPPALPPRRGHGPLAAGLQPGRFRGHARTTSCCRRLPPVRKLQGRTTTSASSLRASSADAGANTDVRCPVRSTENWGGSAERLRRREAARRTFTVAGRSPGAALRRPAHRVAARLGEHASDLRGLSAALYKNGATGPIDGFYTNFVPVNSRTTSTRPTTTARSTASTRQYSGLDKSTLGLLLPRLRRRAPARPPWPATSHSTRSAPVVLNGKLAFGQVVVRSRSRLPGRSSERPAASITTPASPRQASAAS